MSHRTQDLEPLSGVAYFVRELRYHEVTRQSLAVVLILVFALASRTGLAAAVIGMSLAFVGLAIRYYASGFIVKNKVLASNGPYALMRHPLYTGNILLVAGFAIASEMIWTIPVTIVFFWLFYPTAIEYEDRKLHSIFGDEWKSWSARTPALIPKLSNVGAMGGGQWSFATSLRKNGEIVIVIFVLACAARVLWPLF